MAVGGGGGTSPAHHHRSDDDEGHVGISQLSGVSRAAGQNLRSVAALPSLTINTSIRLLIIALVVTLIVAVL